MFFFKVCLKGIGVLFYGFQDLRGLVVCVFGWIEDVCQVDVMYCELGFELYIEGVGDVWVCFWQWYVEIVISFDFVEVVGDFEFFKL